MSLQQDIINDILCDGTNKGRRSILDRCWSKEPGSASSLGSFGIICCVVCLLDVISFF
jgi:hypothetical protein